MGGKRWLLGVSLAIWMAAVGCASASAATYRAVIGSTSGLVQIDTATNTETGFTASGGYLLGVTTAPGGNAAYAAGENTTTSGGIVVPYALNSGNPVAGTVLPFPTMPDNNGVPTGDVVVAPDGRDAYVNDLQNDVVIPLNLTTSPAMYGTAVAIPHIPVGIVYAPDATTAYVLDADGGITVIDVTTGVAQQRTQLSGVTNGVAIALSPDGSTAYVTAAGNGYHTTVYPVAMPGLTVDAPITAGVLSESGKNITLSPSGTEAYVIGANSANHAAVVAIDLTNGTTGTPQDIGGSPESIAITPDGAAIYATTEVGTSSGAVVPIATATMTAGTPITAHIGSAASVAITSPPAPAPSFTVTSAPPGSATTFDASGSTVPTGTITDYAWDFGDGTAAVHATGPTITHVYAATGTYTATLTETASGGGLATATRSVVISTAPAPVFGPFMQGLSFGSVSVGTAGAAQVVTVANDGNGALMIPFDTIGGDDPGDFRVSTDGCSGQSVVSGATCTVSVAFAPTITGTRTATLIFTDDASGSPHSVRLSGTGIAPGVGLFGSPTFGDVSLGMTSAARTVTLTNVGTAPLSIASDSVTGPAASAFAISSDNCARQTLAPGASCATAVTFTPATTGAQTATLVYADNAAGSPQTVALTGTGASTGTVTGTVEDGTQAGRPPLAGAAVTLCRITLDQCAGAFTDAHGRYTFTGVSPGRHIATIDPPSGSTLVQGTRLADVVVGETVDAVTLLEQAQPLPASITIRQGSGGRAGGHPILYWDGPFEITLPPIPAAPAHAAPRSIVYTIVRVALETAGTNQVVVGSTLGYLEAYNQSGNAVGGRAISEPIPGAVAGGFDFTVGGLAITSGGAGVQSRSLGNATEIAAQSDGLRRLAHGTLDLTIRSDRFAAAVHATAANGTDARRDSAAPTADAFESDECEDARTALNVGILFSDGGLGMIVDLPDLNELQADVDKACSPPPPPEQYACHDNIFDNELACSSGGQVPVDPSGFVVTRGGVPLEGATVVLERSDAATGPFTAPPTGSAVMAPENRRNPDSTDLNGHFGWDVFPGFYRVRASRPGCRGTALSGARMVPPPVTDLRLVLSCPGLRRTATRTRVLSARQRGPDTVVVVREQTRGRSPSRRVPIGVITLFTDGRQRGFGFIAPRTGQATIVIAGHLRRRTAVVARYAGNARFAASSASKRGDG